uniref:Antirestriction protein n=1 Tax=Sphingomonas sp. NS2 TaxID=908605 RepID=A0A0D4ZZH6_9SPHN|nr:antirestriction protein [Sphingomonas sp. NS2]
MARNNKTARSNVERADIYQEVTDQIIALLEQGVRPWSPSWASGSASLPLRTCGAHYQGINILLLWAQSMARGYANPTWMTFKKALLGWTAPNGIAMCQSECVARLNQGSRPWSKLPA